MMEKIIIQNPRIDKKAIPPTAIEVLRTIKNAGYQAYIVGGSVRDLLWGHPHLKDFDLVTDATPQEIKHLFKHCIIIGRRFRLAHVYCGKIFFEVATFRASAQHRDPLKTREGMILQDNHYGSLEDDVFRRDFTINALYYDPLENIIIDFVGGYQDLQTKTLRIIGDPHLRYREDPVRMLRAIRFVGKLGCRMTDDTEKPIAELASLLNFVSKSRLYEEILKLFNNGFGKKTLPLLIQHQLFQTLFPIIPPHHPLLGKALTKIDDAIAQDNKLDDIFLYLAFLWTSIESQWEFLQQQKIPREKSLDISIRQVLLEQARHIVIPCKISAQLKETWRLQLPYSPEMLPKFPKTSYALAKTLFALRAEISPELKKFLENWAEPSQNYNSPSKSRTRRRKKRRYY